MSRTGARFLIAASSMVACSPAEERGQTTLPPEVTLEQDLRIDGYEHDLVYMPWLTVSRSGTIAVSLDQDRAVEFFDSTGRPLGIVGGDGDGPGEFRNLARAGWVGDTLWVSDTRLDRLTLIAPDLTVVRSFRWPTVLEPAAGASSGAPSYGGDFISPLSVYPDESVLFWTDFLPPAASDDGESGRLVRASRSGTVEHEVTAVPSAEEMLVLLDVGDQSVVANQIPFFPMPRWSVAPDGGSVVLMTVQARTDSSDARLRVLTSHGEEVFDRTYRFESEPIPASVMDSAIAAQLERRQPSYRAEMEEQLRERAPSFFPPADGLIVGSDGRSWIGLRATVEGKPWMVVDRNGEPSAVVTFPVDVRLMAADATHLYAIERDPIGVESIVRYRLGSEPAR